MITMTEKAAKHVARYLERRGKGVGLRVGVKTTGCSGLAYKLEYVDEVLTYSATRANDDPLPTWLAFDTLTRTFTGTPPLDFNGTISLKVIVDPKSLPYIDGTELDFAREGLNEGFRFNNPNVKDECGCGESFRV